MVRLNAFVALAVVCGSLCAAPADSPFPVPPPQPVAPPTPAPSGTVLNLAADSLYIVNSSKDGALRIHPAGLVTISKETGPLTIKGKFADGGGKSETRKYAGPFVFIVEPVAGAKGRIELDFIPYGFKSDAEISTATVDVNGGQAPQPPPVDPVEPVKPVDPLLIAFQSAYDAEASLLKSSDKKTLVATFNALAAAVLDAAVKTGDDNFTLLTNSINAQIGDRLKSKLRPVIGAEINKILPNGAGKGPVVLTAQNKADAAALYLKIAKTLEQVK